MTGVNQVSARGIEQQLVSIRQSTLSRLTQSRVVSQFLGGNPSKRTYVGYLKNVYHYACHSAVVIGIAGARAVPRSPKVGRYLLHHAIEETGHEAWAFSDLKDLGLSAEEILESRPTVHCLGMIGMEYHYAAHANPLALLGWMYTLEALGDDVGHMISRTVGESLALGGKGTYFLSGHGEADHDHIKDITGVIVEEVSPGDIGELLYVAQCSAEFYVGLINDVLTD